MLKKILTIILILLTININATVVRISKGEEASFDGVLVSENTFDGMVKDIKIGELNKELIVRYKNINNLQNEALKNREEQVIILRNQNDKLSDRLYKHQTYSNLQKTIWFVLGVITTSLAVKLGRDI